MRSFLQRSISGPSGVPPPFVLLYAEPSIEDYLERGAKQVEFWKSQNGKQSGDPANSPGR